MSTVAHIVAVEGGPEGRRMMRVTRHAVERYVERVKPMLEYGAAVRELELLFRGCAETSERPVWANVRDATGWIVPSDGIAFPVVGVTVVSCLTRAEVGVELRLVREPRGDRARRARKRRKQHGKVARGERRRARDRRTADG